MASSGPALLNSDTHEQAASTGAPGSVVVRNVSKTFRLPVDRPQTIKQRVLHPVQSRVIADELHALQNVSFEIAPGEFFGIVGRNGSGKSTLLKCLAGIYGVDSGTIETNGRVSPFIELGVGFNPELSARDNVVVNAALLGLSRSETLARFDDVIAFAELQDFVGLKLKNYSSGMQVRLGFAATIQADAQIYLVDEVLAVGDARFQEKCFKTFREMKRAGKTVVFVTHDLGTVQRFCDRVMLLEKGERMAIGSPDEVTMTYRQHDLDLERGERPVARAGTKRWGDQAAEIDEAWVEDESGSRTGVFEQRARLVFRARASFKESMVDPVFGVAFKHESGVNVFVTNTAVDRVETGTRSAGDTVEYSVAFDVPFADGGYTVSPSIAHRDGQRFADWRDDLLVFRVTGVEHTGGLVDFPHETTFDG